MSRHRKHLQQQPAEAERELDVATKLSEVRAAATRSGWRWKGCSGLTSRRGGSGSELPAAPAIVFPHDLFGLVDLKP